MSALITGIPESAAIRLNGNFGLVVYGLPVLSGFLADWMGFRRAIMMAYAFLAVGYFLAGEFTTYWSIAGALLLTIMGVDLVTAAGASAASIGNVGPGLAAVGPAANYAWMPAPGKLVLSLLMLLGRLEIYTVLVLFHPEFWRR